MLLRFLGSASTAWKILAVTSSSRSILAESAGSAMRSLARRMFRRMPE